MNNFHKFCQSFWSISLPTGHCRLYPCNKLWPWCSAATQPSNAARYIDLPLCSGLRVGLGASRVVSTKWDLPTGDEICRPKYGGLRQSLLHCCNCSVLSRLSLPPSVGGVCPLCRLDRYHVLVHLLSLTRDETSSNRRDVLSLGEPLVLEEHCVQGWRWWRGSKKTCKWSLGAFLALLFS